MPSSSKRIIELCGKPGVGKTTVARELANLPECSRVILEGKFQIIGYFLLGCIKMPSVFWSAYMFAFKHVNSISEFWSLYVYRYARYVKATRSSTAVCILDEGPRQSLFGYAIAGVSEKDLKDFYTIMPPVNACLFLEIDETVRLQQLQKRKHKRQLNKKQEIRDQHEDLALASKTLHSIAAQEDEALYVMDSDLAIRRFLNTS